MGGAGRGGVVADPDQVGCDSWDLSYPEGPRFIPALPS